MAFAASHIMLRYSLWSSWWWQFTTHSVLTCFTSFLSSHSFWMQTVVMFHRHSCMPCYKLTQCLFAESYACWEKIHRQETFSLHSYAFPPWLFVDGELERVLMLGLVVIDKYYQMHEQKLLDSCWVSCRESMKIFLLLDIIPCIFSCKQ